MSLSEVMELKIKILMLEQENAKLRRMFDSAAERIYVQSELLSKCAERSDDSRLLRRRIYDAELALSRHVVPDSLEEMIRQAVTDRAELLKERTQLR